MKKIYPILALLFFSTLVNAQQPQTSLPDRVNLQKTSNPQHPFLRITGIGQLKSINGYQVRIISGLRSGYGYAIMQNNKAVLQQLENPMPYAALGIQSADDAFKIATWQIAKHEELGQWIRFIPRHIAIELKINSAQ
jgi:hypothetical protein